MRTIVQLQSAFDLLKRGSRAVAFVGVILVGSASAQSEPWTDLAGGLSGATGIPVMSGHGSLYPGTTVTLRVSDAAPSSSAVFSLSYTLGSTSAFGGTARTLPSAWTQTVSTNSEGIAETQIVLPTSTPGGLQFYLEAFVLDDAAPEGVAISNCVRGLTVPSSAIPDPVAFYDTVVNEAEQAAANGMVSSDLYDYLTANPTYFMYNPAAVLDATTAVYVSEFSEDTTQGPSDVGGGIVRGLRWSFRNIFGFEIGFAQLEVPWTKSTCHSKLGTPVAAGNLPLGSFWAEQVGAKWAVQCGPTAQCEQGRTKECGNFRICYNQRFIYFIKLTSGCTRAETICAPCP